MAFANAGAEAAFTKAQLDQQVGNLCVQARAILHEANELQANFIAAHVDADFTAAAGGPGPTGYTSGDIATLKSAILDLSNLFLVANGTNAQVLAHNFFAFSDQLAGPDIV